jgi:hypothetical protein
LCHIAEAFILAVELRSQSGVYVNESEWSLVAFVGIADRSAIEGDVVAGTEKENVVPLLVAGQLGIAPSCRMCREYITGVGNNDALHEGIVAYHQFCSLKTLLNLLAERVGIGGIELASHGHRSDRRLPQSLAATGLSMYHDDNY